MVPLRSNWVGLCVSYVLHNNQSSSAQVWFIMNTQQQTLTRSTICNVWSAYVDLRGTNFCMDKGRTYILWFYIHTNKVSMWEDTKGPIKQINNDIISIEHHSISSISFCSRYAFILRVIRLIPFVFYLRWARSRPMEYSIGIIP